MVGKPIALADSRDKKAWHAERGRGVTKTDVVRLVSGSLAAKQAVYADKHGGKTFHGNASTERGHRLEPIALEWAEAQLGIPASGVLYAHHENRLHRATPDAFTWDEGEGALVEVKTHKEDWSKRIPRKIMRDIWWQSYVLGAGFAALVHWQVDDKGQPLTMEPESIEVGGDRIPWDDDELGRLIKAADDYLAWVDAGCPTTDESGVPTHIREAIAAVNAGRDADKVIREWIKGNPAADEGLDLQTEVGSLRWVMTNGSSFDKAAWERAEPEAAALFAAAQEKYRKPTSGGRLTVAAPKEEESA